MATSGEQIPAPFRAGVPNAGAVSYPADQIEAWALATQPGKVAAVGKAYTDASKQLFDSVQVLLDAAKQLAKVWKGPDAQAALEQMRLMADSAGRLAKATQATGGALSIHGGDNLPYLKWYFGPGTWWASQKQQAGGSLTTTAFSGTPQQQAAAAALQKEAERQLSLHNGHITETYYRIPPNADVTLPPGGEYSGYRPVSGDSPTGSSVAGGTGTSSGGGAGGHVSGPHMPAPGASVSGPQPGGETDLAGLPPGAGGSAIGTPGVGTAPGASFGPGGGAGSAAGGGPGFFAPGAAPGGSLPRGVIGAQQTSAQAARQATTAMGPGGVTQPGMAVGGGHNEDKERQSADYLREDSGAWHVDDEATPPVIGALPEKRPSAVDDDSEHQLQQEEFELRRLHELLAVGPGEVQHLAELNKLDDLEA